MIRTIVGFVNYCCDALEIDDLPTNRTENDSALAESFSVRTEVSSVPR